MQLYVYVVDSLPCDKWDSLAEAGVISKTPRCFSQLHRITAGKKLWHSLSKTFILWSSFLSSTPSFKCKFQLYLTILKDKYHELFKIEKYNVFIRNYFEIPLMDEMLLSFAKRLSLWLKNILKNNFYIKNIIWVLAIFSLCTLNITA